MISAAMETLRNRAYIAVGVALLMVAMAILLGVLADRRSYKNRGGKRYRDITTMKRKK